MRDPVLILESLEQQTETLAALIVAGDAIALQSAGASLQALGVELVQLVPLIRRYPAAAKVMRQRLQVLSARMQLLRSNLLRRTAWVDMAVGVVVPTPAKSTYSVGAGVYGKTVRQSGAFKVLAA